MVDDEKTLHLKFVPSFLGLVGVAASLFRKFLGVTVLSFPTPSLVKLQY
jgi:hypothetical protein